VTKDAYDVRAAAWEWMRAKKQFSTKELRTELKFGQHRAWQFTAFFVLAGWLKRDGWGMKAIFSVAKDLPLTTLLLYAPMDKCLDERRIMPREIEPRTYPARERQNQSNDPSRFRPPAQRRPMDRWTKLDGSTMYPPWMIEKTWHEAVCEGCGERTIYRKETAETLRGWRRTKKAWKCHKCAKGIDTRRKKS
jgi:predicted RNA-binding Zn-ribbon protein involved in translation (DUF1610 family)